MNYSLEQAFCNEHQRFFIILAEMRMTKWLENSEGKIFINKKKLEKNCIFEKLVSHERALLQTISQLYFVEHATIERKIKKN
jgi:hypothetical protein